MLFCKSNNYSNFAFIKIISVIARMLKNSKKKKQNPSIFNKSRYLKRNTDQANNGKTKLFNIINEISYKGY